MSGILDRLRHYGLIPGGIIAVRPGDMRGALVKADDVRDALRSDETRRKITEVLAENGVQPNTDAMHSWRCNEPDRFPGYCSCVPQLVDDLIDVLAGGE
jgi:hypothetical protein